MQLANMHDVGGCRVVVESVNQLRRVERRLKKNRPPLRHADYVKSPRSSGYRAVHVVVGYEDEARAMRAIEVQLRTKVMHEWAIAVERISGRVREDLKSGRGHNEVLRWFAAVSEAMAIEEFGGEPPPALLTTITDLRSRAMPYMA